METCKPNTTGCPAASFETKNHSLKLCPNINLENHDIKMIVALRCYTLGLFGIKQYATGTEFCRVV
jgi:hypothetical protein